MRDGNPLLRIKKHRCVQKCDDVEAYTPAAESGGREQIKYDHYDQCLGSVIEMALHEQRLARRQR